MFILDYHLFVNLLKFCDKSHLFPLLLTSKEIKDLTWRHLIDFIEINLLLRNHNIKFYQKLKEEKIRRVVDMMIQFAIDCPVNYKID